MEKQINKLQWQGTLLKKDIGKDVNDRPIINYEEKRKIYYCDLGVFADEKYLSSQNKTEVVRKIAIRLDKSITEKDYSIKISNVVYNISRIYIDEYKKEMELSLSYVD